MPFKKNDVNKEKILKSALAVFSESGVKGSTIIDIAKRTKVNKALIYYYFSDKDFLFENVIKRNLANVIFDFKKILSAEQKSKSSIDLVVKTFRAIKIKHNTFFKLLLSELLKEDSEKISDIIVDIFSKENINLQAEINKIFSDDSFDSEISLFNRELVVLWIGLLSSDIISEKLIPKLLNIQNNQLNLFNKNLDQLVTKVGFTSKN